MSLGLRDLALLLAILSIILLSSSLVHTRARKSIINKRRLELAAHIVGVAFLMLSFYLIWESLG